MDREKLKEKIEELLEEFDCYCEYMYNKEYKQEYVKKFLDCIVPDGVVVLTKEELEAHDKEVSKKTAEEFATNFENYMCDVNTDYCTDDTVPETLFTSAEIDKVVDRTLKDFGVEVDE